MRRVRGTEKRAKEDGYMNTFIKIEHLLPQERANEKILLQNSNTSVGAHAIHCRKKMGGSAELYNRRLYLLKQWRVQRQG